MHKSQRFAVLVSLSALTSTVYAQDFKVCETLINKGLREYSISNTSQAYLNSVRDEYCRQDGSSNVTNAGFGLDIVIKAIPISLTGSYSNAQQAFSNFCRNYSALTQSSSSTANYDETIVRRAYDSFDACVKFISLGISVSHQVVNVSALNFSLTAGVMKPIKLTGVATSSNVKCYGNIPSVGYGELTAKTAATIDNTTLAFYCSRTPDRDQNGTSNYHEGTIQVLTNWGNYSVLWPRDRQLPETSGVAINTELNALRAALKLTDERITGISLAETAPFTGAEYDCNKTQVANAPFTYMVGMRDGTGCGVTNLHYYKTLSLTVPRAIVVAPVQNAQLVQRPDQYIASTLQNIRASLGALNTRINGIALAETGQVSSGAYACGGAAVSATSFQLMVGKTDGTSCGVPNVHYLKQLSLTLPH